jgi:hypothetical protein
MKKKIKNKIIISVFILITLGCDTKKENKFDFYSIKAIDIKLKGSYKWIEHIYLLKYKKNSKFNSLVSRDTIDLRNFDFYPDINESSILIREIDYHYDFILIIQSKSKESKHKFSNVIVTKFKANPFDLYRVTSYIYNSKIYKDDKCDFYLSSPDGVSIR